jgi:hypothetical protein
MRCISYPSMYIIKQGYLSLNQSTQNLINMLVYHNVKISEKTKCNRSLI